MKLPILLLLTLPVLPQSTPPSILSKVEPTWPTLTSNYLLEPAEVRITILPNGEPASITALGAAIPDNVVRALAQWRFTPHKQSVAHCADLPPSEPAITLRVPIRRPLNADLERGQFTAWLPSSEILKAIENGRKLDASSAEQLQANLPRGELPDQSRASLLVYYATKGASNDLAAAIKARRDLLLFLVKTFPQDEILSSPFATINTSGEPLANALAIPALKDAWLAALHDYPKDLLVAEGAIAFFRTIDPAVALRVISEHKDADIQSNILGDLYARAGLGINTIDPATGRALATSIQDLNGAGLPKSFRDALLESKDLKLVLSGVDTTTLVSHQLNTVHALPAGYGDYCQALMQHLRSLYPQTSLDCSLGAHQGPEVYHFVPFDKFEGTLLKKVQPPYPRAAKKQHIFGDVRFLVNIDTTGRVQNVELLSAPLPLYETTYNAVQQWQYQPLVINGKPAKLPRRWSSALLPNNFQRCLALWAFLFCATSWASDKTQPVTLETKVEPDWGSLTANFIPDTASVELVVLPSGEPFSIESTTSLPDPVVRALAQWRFTKSSKAFKITIKVPIRRQISEYYEVLQQARFDPGFDAGFLVKQGLELDAKKASRLLSRLSESETKGTRTILLAYYATKGLADIDGARKARLDLISWLIQNDPHNAILKSYYAFMNSSGEPLADSSAVSALTQQWIEAVKQNPADIQTVTAATNLLRVTNPTTALQMINALPNSARKSNLLGNVYSVAALGIIAISPDHGLPIATASQSLPEAEFAVNARKILLRSTDPSLVLSGMQATADAHALAGNQSLPSGYSEFCQSLLKHTKEIFPTTKATCDFPPGKTEMKDPELQQKVQPRYPPDAKQARLPGKVLFSAVIGADGLPHNLELLSAPFPFYEESRKAISQWTWSPALVNGSPKSIVTEIVVNYTIEQ